MPMPCIAYEVQSDPWVLIVPALPGREVEVMHPSKKGPEFDM